MKWLFSALGLGLVCLCLMRFGDLGWTNHDGFITRYTTDQWLTLILYLAWTPVTIWIIRKLLRAGFKVRKKYVDLPVTESSAKSARRAASLLGAAAIWYLWLPCDTLPYPDDIASALHFIVIASSVWLIASVWEGFCDSLTEKATNLNKRAEKLLIPVTRKLVRAVIIVGGALILLGTYSVDYKGIAAGLGIGGLVMALAAKDSVENIFGSLTILFDMPFALGDWVKIGTVDGIVEEINLRSTRIRTFEDSIITLPNSNLIKASVENMGARRVRRQKFLIRLSYETGVDSVEKISKDLIAFLDQVPGIEKGRSVVQMNDLGETSFGVLVQCYFETNEFQEEMRLRGEVMRRILQLAGEHGAEFFNGQSRTQSPQKPS